MPDWAGPACVCVCFSLGVLAKYCVALGCVSEKIFCFVFFPIFFFYTVAPLLFTVLAARAAGREPSAPA